MQFINYFFASAISFLGLAIGICLVKIAPEEQKPLEHSMKIVQGISLVLIFSFIEFYYFKSWFYLMVFFAYFLFAAFITLSKTGHFRKLMPVYSVLGILFSLSSANKNLFTIESGLIMIYGIPAAALVYSKKQKNEAKILLSGVIFIAIAVILFFA